MDRIDFIEVLADELSYRVKPSEIHQLINYYDEMIDDLMEEGYSEQDAVAKLGDPKKLAQEAAGIQEIEIEVPRRFNPLVILLLILGFPLWGSLAFAFLMVLLSFYIVLWCVPFTTGTFGFGMAFGGLVATFFSPFMMMDTFFQGVTQLGVGMLCFGIGLISLVFTCSISGFFLKATRSLTIWTKNLIFKRRKKVVQYEAQ